MITLSPRRGLVPNSRFRSFPNLQAFTSISDLSHLRLSLGPAVCTGPAACGERRTPSVSSVFANRYQRTCVFTWCGMKQVDEQTLSTVLYRSQCLSHRVSDKFDVLFSFIRSCLDFCRRADVCSLVLISLPCLLPPPLPSSGNSPVLCGETSDGGHHCHSASIWEIQRWRL